MIIKKINEIAKYLLSKEKGILAADENIQKMGAKFQSIGISNTSNNRRDFREVLISSNCIQDNIGGIILHEETLYQNAKNGIRLKDLILKKKSLVGIKVDKGLKDFNNSDSEKITDGLNGLNNRCKKYYKEGASFTKWRAAIFIGKDIPTKECIDHNVMQLVEYAKIVQDNNMVPIVEPEVIMEGDHDIHRCYEVTQNVLTTLFNKLENNNIKNDSLILKCNMITPSNNSKVYSSCKIIAEKTNECLKNSLPNNISGVAFLSGGQTDLNATRNLNEINKLNKLSYPLSFSFGRALKTKSLEAWSGDNKNNNLAQLVFEHRVLMNKLALSGKWTLEQEKN